MRMAGSRQISAPIKYPVRSVLSIVQISPSEANGNSTVTNVPKRPISQRSHVYPLPRTCTPSTTVGVLLHCKFEKSANQRTLITKLGTPICSRKVSAHSKIVIVASGSVQSQRNANAASAIYAATRTSTPRNPIRPMYCFTCRGPGAPLSRCSLMSRITKSISIMRVVSDSIFSETSSSSLAIHDRVAASRDTAQASMTMPETPKITLLNACSNAAVSCFGVSTGTVFSMLGTRTMIRWRNPPGSPQAGWETSRATRRIQRSARLNRRTRESLPGSSGRSGSHGPRFCPY